MFLYNAQPLGAMIHNPLTANAHLVEFCVKGYHIKSKSLKMNIIRTASFRRHTQTDSVCLQNLSKNTQPISNMENGLN
jgi:hypothetical protein